ncbi:AMP-binding protein [Leptospira sp. 2 VSF19]|uniref:AMP-binding protein n=1 Tax=Leptospira soteropolitanensis TaxID=2950025 RepID=A0AAW5VG36_9LEPT|nr:AMP-binding protein [Leptospira soteropolitanensis]MCW7492594.1 AMP-binding protein [Leptospira soteropolitanensis]MCW7500277.1 AMP-binding protein [Leptospira soteropolitanensis]MCW7522688.1 AMP-binding protein [Leptospira soteropolitanensis]MCW7526544.1 AMP-binding protein [Leptospira soteropolitanensis]MCW7530247.1 AMP-binding protein [Leptospira soteropolitanensis]
MASVLRFANNEYFLSGNFEFDLVSQQNPILVDPLWKGTKLEEHLSAFPLPFLETKKSFCLVTSGSTGLPKMVVKQWNEIEEELVYWEKKTEIQSLYENIGTVHVQVPLCHLYGLLWGYLLPKRFGVSIDVSPSSENRKLWITSAPKLQSILSLGNPLPESAVVSGMKFPVPLSRSLRDKGGISVLEIYGSTETGGIGYRDPLRQNRFQILPTIQTKFKSESGPEETELQIQSPFLSLESFLLEKEGWTKHSLSLNAYYPTGDLGNWSELGWFLLGRKDRIIKHNGKRVSLDRIESEILGLALPGEFLCVPVKDNFGFGETIGLFCTSQLPTSEILENLRKELPDSHVPRVVLQKESIPKLPNGKPDYPTITKLCNEHYRQIQNQISILKNQKQIDSHFSVREILESILGLKPEENKHLVYDYGMDSIQYTELILKLERKIEHKIPEEDKQTSYFASLSGIEEYLKEKLYLLK